MIEIARRLTIDEQRQILQACNQVIQQAPLFTKTMPTGAAFRYRCTSAGSYGWMSDKKGFRYVEAHPITDEPFPEMPAFIDQIAIESAAAYGLSIRPESSLINWYHPDSSLGLHQDKTEFSRAPVVSISIDDDCIFLDGGLQRRTPKRELILISGDVLIFGAEDRLVFHGVKAIVPETAPPILA